MAEQEAIAITTTTWVLKSFFAFCQDGTLEQVLGIGEKSQYPFKSEDIHFDSFPGNTTEEHEHMLAQISSRPIFTPWNVAYFVLYGYFTSAVVANIVAWYKFITTWNLIVNERRLDLSFFVQRRLRLTLKEALRTHVRMDTMECTTCCICLAEFKENELVTSCDDGCKKWFHRECLFNWLDYQDNCPCCRIDMLSKKSKSKGVLMDLMEFVGFKPDS